MNIEPNATDTIQAFKKRRRVIDKKGSYCASILNPTFDGLFAITYHATKGYRRKRVTFPKPIAPWITI